MSAFASGVAPHRRVWVYLAATFAITWGAWWGLVLIARAGLSAFGQPLFMTLYLLGGFGPTIAAYLAVRATRDEGTLAEFHSRLLRWRVGLRYWLMTLLFPFVLAGLVVLGALWWEPAVRSEIVLKSWWMALPLLLGMIIGGGSKSWGGGVWRSRTSIGVSGNGRRSFCSVRSGRSGTCRSFRFRGRGSSAFRFAILHLDRRIGRSPGLALPPNREHPVLHSLPRSGQCRVCAWAGAQP